MLSQFVIDMMTLVTDMFTELLSCDLSLFEELFSVVGDLYTNVMLPMGIALLLLICVWQLFKSMFGKAGVSSEDPIELVCRTGISLFFIVAAKPLVDYILTVAGTPYQWIAGTDIEVSSFSEYVSALEGLTGGLGIDSLNIAVLMLIMQFVVAWNYFKMLFVIAERYVLLGVFSYTAPLAFGTGGSKATNNILASWAKMFGGQIVLIILNSWCLKMFLSGYGNLNASSYGFTKFFVATLCLVGFCKVTFKLDSYLSSLGVNLGRPTTGIGALGLMMAAGRVLIAFQIRLDVPYQKRKYVWLSSAKMEKGCSPGSPVSFSGVLNSPVVYVTEGVLKAEAAYQRTGQPYLGNPGVSAYKELELALNRLKAHGVKVVIEANDMDKCIRLHCDRAYSEACADCEGSSHECPKKREKRDHIRKGCLKLYEICEKLGLICKRAVWDTDDEGYWQENYKGIDDWKLREL